MPEWLPFVFDGQGRATPDTADARRAIELVMRRYHELAAYLAAREPFDPIVFELEDDEGKSLTGKDAIGALTPWAAGLAHAFDIVPALSAAYDTDADLAAALSGVLRHLPLDPDDASPEAADFLLERDRIDRDVPLARPRRGDRRTRRLRARRGRDHAAAPTAAAGRAEGGTQRPVPVRQRPQVQGVSRPRERTEWTVNWTGGNA